MQWRSSARQMLAFRKVSRYNRAFYRRRFTESHVSSKHVCRQMIVVNHGCSADQTRKLEFNEVHEPKALIPSSLTSVINELESTSFSSVMRPPTWHYARW